MDQIYHEHLVLSSLPLENGGSQLYCVRNVVAHGDAQEGKWRGNWRMEWVTSTLTRPRNAVYPALLTLMRTPRLPAVDWTDSPADLNGLVRLGDRQNLVSACVPSGSARALTRRRLSFDWEALRRVMAAKLIRLPQKTAIVRHLVWKALLLAVLWPSASSRNFEHAFVFGRSIGLHSPINFFFLSKNISLNTLFSNSLGLSSSVNIRD